MESIIKKALSIRGWKSDYYDGHGTYYRMINGVFASITLHAKGLRYKLKGLVEMVVMYDDIHVIDGRYLVMNKGTLLIADNS